MDPKEAIQLLERYRNGESTEAEKALVEQWYEQLNDTGDFQWNGGERVSMEQLIHSRLIEQIHVQKLVEKKGKVRRMSPWRWIAAASIIVMLSVGGYLLFFNKTKVAGPEVTVAKNNDVPAPKETRAVITLADGSKVYLDSAETGTLATQANITVERSADGKIVYQPTNDIAKEIVYNTLTNPRGSKVIDMQLSDGSHVWLNAGSSIKYPVAFIGNERKVEITGEAYFEVAHDAAHPFFVGKGDVSVQVLGTHFNVNAYDDEPNLKVTLLEGSVKVSNGISNATIKPAQQAQVSSGVKVVNGADLDEVMAWKNGEFQFGDKSDIGSVMREISRWYDVDVEVKGDINGHIGGSISRTVNISKVLQMLEATGMIHYKVEGKRVTITP